jgi:hypothetical protein
MGRRVAWRLQFCNSPRPRDRDASASTKWEPGGVVSRPAVPANRLARGSGASPPRRTSRRHINGRMHAHRRRGVRSQNGRPARPDATVHKAWWWAVATRHAGCCATRQAVGWLGSDWPMRSTALLYLGCQEHGLSRMRCVPVQSTAPPVLCCAVPAPEEAKPSPTGASCRAQGDERELAYDQRVISSPT